MSLLSVFFIVLAVIIPLGINYLTIFAISEWRPVFQGYSDDHDRIISEIWKAVRLLIAGASTLFFISLLLPFVPWQVSLSLGVSASSAIAFYFFGLLETFREKEKEQRDARAAEREREEQIAAQNERLDQDVDIYIQAQIDERLTAIGLQALLDKWDEDLPFSEAKLKAMPMVELAARRKLMKNWMEDYSERRDNSIEDSENITRLPPRND